MNGSTKILITKSLKAKLNINTFKVVCNDLVHKIAPIINRLP